MELERFQMIDRIVSVDDAVTVLTAQSKVPENSLVFEGHFPGMPLVPGVLLIETMAQASGFLVLAKTGFAAMPFLVGVKQGKLRTFVEPKTELDVEARIEHDGSGFAVTTASIKSDGKKICDAQLTLKTMPFPDASFAEMIVNRARQLNCPEHLLG
ncbi:MAG: 3-hydroxyacyl-ACP dehydratase FabZ family protein [Rhizobiaceae bacterium]